VFENAVVSAAHRHIGKINIRKDRFYTRTEKKYSKARTRLNKLRRQKDNDLSQRIELTKRLKGLRAKIDKEHNDYICRKIRRAASDSNALQLFR